MGKNNLETTYKWRLENLKRYELTINKITEKDVYKHLEKQKNKRAYIIELIRKDIDENN